MLGEWRWGAHAGVLVTSRQPASRVIRHSTGDSEYDAAPVNHRRGHRTIT